MSRTKRSLLVSVLSILLCLSMLLGTTYAWFTDSVSSTGNRIVSGSLSVDMLHFVDDEWVSLKKNPDHKIFDYDRWEPGYTRVDKIKIANLGDLALRYQLTASVKIGTEINGFGGERLADVIDVYLYDGEHTAASFAEIRTSADWTRAGTLSELLGAKGLARGQLLPAGDTPTADAPAGERVISVALHMQESAGNEYQLLSVGDIHLTLAATQYTYESDSFGDDYDTDALFPEIKYNFGISRPVDTAADGTSAAEVVINDADNLIEAVVPAGTKLVPGTDTLTLSVTDLEQSNPNITLDPEEQMRSVDVHVEGVAADNTTPIIVTVKRMMPLSLNVGNFTLFHVENNIPNAMTQVADESELDAHNEFVYDPATGDVKMALASFSEVAAKVSAPVWAGGFSTSLRGEGTASDPYLITCADDLALFGAMVGGMKGKEADSFAGKYVSLVADIDLGYRGTEDYHIFYPIGYYNSEGTYERTTEDAITSGFKRFEGTFDGLGHTISNFYQNTWDMKGDNEEYDLSLQYYRDGMGLFGKVYGGTVKNLTVRNFSSDGEYTTTGVIAAYADFGATFENITIFDCNPRVYNIGNGGIVGAVGWYTTDVTDKKVTFTNITVDRTNKISALWGSWGVACAGIVGQYYPTSGQSAANYPANPGVVLNNCHIAAQIDANNDVCGNYQYYWYRYAGMVIGSIRDNVTIKDSGIEGIDGYTVPNLSGIEAYNCTVHFGDWNNYYYCELVANTIASYTHDHQMSRLTQVKSLDANAQTYVPLGSDTAVSIPKSGRYNYVVVNGTHGTDNATCYHFVDGKQHFHDVADADNPVVEETVNGQIVLKEDKTCVYLPFNQLFQGDGWGIKHIVLNQQLPDLAEYFNTTLDIEVLDDNEGYAVDKFVQSTFGEDGDRVVEEVSFGYEIELGRFFSKNPEVMLEIKPENITLSATGVGDQSNTTANRVVLSKNDSTDWTKWTVRFNVSGTYELTIQDYYYCKPATVTVTATDPRAGIIDNHVYVAQSLQDTFNGVNDQYSDKIVYANEYTDFDALMCAAYNELNRAIDGQIVIIGKIKQDTLFRAPSHTGTVTIMGIDDASAIEVQQKKDALDNRFFVGGNTVFDNIRLERQDDARADLFGWNLVGLFNDITITSTVTTEFDEEYQGIIVLGAQGGGVKNSQYYDGAKDATLTIESGYWSEVIGTVRTSFSTSNLARDEEARHFAGEFQDYDLTFNLDGDASVGKLFTFCRTVNTKAGGGTGDSIDIDIIKNELCGKNSSATVNLRGGRVYYFICANDYTTNISVGYDKGTTVNVCDEFDFDHSFTKSGTLDNVFYGISGQGAYTAATTGKGESTLYLPRRFYNLYNSATANHVKENINADSFGAVVKVVFVDDTVTITESNDVNGSSATHPVNSLDSAYEKLGDNGGKIVIVGKYTLGANFTESAHTGTVTITGTYAGVDREGELATGGTARAYTLAGPTVFENIKFSTTDSKGLLIEAQYNPVTLGEGVVCSGFTASGIASALSIIGGYNNRSSSGVATGKTEGTESNITILSCTALDNKGVIIVGADRLTNAGDAYVYESPAANVNITVEGGDITHLYAGNSNSGTLAAEINLTINGGTFNASNITFEYTGSNVHIYTGEKITVTISGATFTSATLTKPDKSAETPEVITITGSYDGLTVNEPTLKAS